MVPVRMTGRREAVARRMRAAAMAVGEGRTSLGEFSTGPLLSKRRMSCVPVPISTARIRMVIV